MIYKTIVEKITRVKYKTLKERLKEKHTIFMSRKTQYLEDSNSPPNNQDIQLNSNKNPKLIFKNI